MSSDYKWEFAKPSFNDFGQVILEPGSDFDRQLYNQEGKHICELMNLSYAVVPATRALGEEQINATTLPTVGRDEILCIRLSFSAGQSYPLSTSYVYQIYYPLFSSDT